MLVIQVINRLAGSTACVSHLLYITCLSWNTYERIIKCGRLQNGIVCCFLTISTKWCIVRKGLVGINAHAQKEEEEKEEEWQQRLFAVEKGISSMDMCRTREGTVCLVRLEMFYIGTGNIIMTVYLWSDTFHKCPYIALFWKGSSYKSQQHWNYKYHF